MSTNLKKIPGDLISQSEAARLRGVTRQAISKLVKKGHLQGFGVGGKQLVRKSDVLAYKPRPPGRPSTKSGTRPKQRS